MDVEEQNESEQHAFQVLLKADWCLQLTKQTVTANKMKFKEVRSLSEGHIGNTRST